MEWLANQAYEFLWGQPALQETLKDEDHDLHAIFSKVPFLTIESFPAV